jgi:hypothetical protein
VQDRTVIKKGNKKREVTAAPPANLENLAGGFGLNADGSTQDLERLVLSHLDSNSFKRIRSRVFRDLDG